MGANSYYTILNINKRRWKERTFRFGRSVLCTQILSLSTRFSDTLDCRRVVKRKVKIKFDQVGHMAIFGWKSLCLAAFKSEIEHVKTRGRTHSYDHPVSTYTTWRCRVFEFFFSFFNFAFFPVSVKRGQHTSAAHFRSLVRYYCGVISGLGVWRKRVENLLGNRRRTPHNVSS